MGTCSGSSTAGKATQSAPTPNYNPTEIITKQYGARVAFTNEFKDNVKLLKQDAKEGNLQMESWFAKDISDTAYYYGYDDNRDVQRFAQSINGIVRTASTGDRVKTQREIKELQESRYNDYSPKYQQRLNRKIYK